MPEMPESSRGGSDTARGMPDAVNEIRQGVAGNPIPEALETPGSDPSTVPPPLAALFPQVTASTRRAVLTRRVVSTCVRSARTARMCQV